MEACARADWPGDALFLYAVAGASARFDSLRVADCTAHQAQQIVLMRHRDVVPGAATGPRRLGDYVRGDWLFRGVRDPSVPA